MVLPDGENSIVSTSACSLAMTRQQMAPALNDVREHDVVLLQGNLPIDTTGFLLATARERKARTIFNPAPFWLGAEKLTEHCSLVVANRGETEALGDAITAAERAVVTLGGEGCVLIEGGKRRAFAAEPVTAVDTTGYGDAFCGALAAMLASGWSVERSIDAAQKAAAITATRPGAFDALPSSAELMAISGLKAR
jgi:ribokinase